MDIGPFLGWQMNSLLACLPTSPQNRYEILEAGVQKNTNLDEGPSKRLPKQFQATKHFAKTLKSKKQRVIVVEDSLGGSDMWSKPNPQGSVLCL